MFYHPKDGHGLPHNPFNAIITPRPIGWISTRGKDGSDNLAPYSFFNGVAYEPPQVMFASVGSKSDDEAGKDSLRNVQETGFFCVNIAEKSAFEAMNTSSGVFPYEVDEFDVAKLDRVECQSIPCARVASTPAALECKLTQITPLPGHENYVVFGEVCGVYMRDDCIVNGCFDVTTFQPLARLGYRDFTFVDKTFTAKRPGE